MDLKNLVINRLKEYREKHNYNTYQLRKIERAGEPKPIAGVNVTTLNLIQQGKKVPTPEMQEKLLNFFGIKYEIDSWNNIKLTNNGEVL